jgi:hypothetical protein
VRAGVSAKRPRPASQYRCRIVARRRAAASRRSRARTSDPTLLEVGRVAVGEEQLQVEGRRRAVEHGGHPARPGPRPVHEVPPGQRPQRAVRGLTFGEEPEHGPDARQHPAHEGRIVLVAPVVVDHPDPPEREGRDVLLQARRGAALGEAFGGPRIVELGDGIAHQPAVPRRVQRDEGLDARVARVLELLVVRAVHVGLVRAQPGRAPADLEDPVQLRRARVEARPRGERIRGGDGGQVVDGQRLLGRLHFELDVAVRPPPEGPEPAPGSAIRDEDVARPAHLLALHVVAVALDLAAGLQERLRVAEGDRRPSAARHRQLRIRGGQVVLVE